MQSFLLYTSIACIVASSLLVKSGAYPAADLMPKGFPGQPSSVPFKQFSGYLDISTTRHIHYIYVESQRNPAKDPVVFWTNGGPGCSGLLGFFAEMGPWRPVKSSAPDGSSANYSLKMNPYSWNRIANMVFLEQPVGVGFSYADVDIGLLRFGDAFSSIDNLRIVKRFFEKFPERASNDFYLASESYGGHYIPQWAMRVLNDESLVSRFKGVLVGNPYVQLGSLYAGSLHALWGQQLIPLPLWEDVLQYGCDDMRLGDDEYPTICYQIRKQLFHLNRKINPYSLTYPVCLEEDHEDAEVDDDYVAGQEGQRDEEGIINTQGRSGNIGARATQGEVLFNMLRRHVDMKIQSALAGSKEGTFSVSVDKDSSSTSASSAHSKWLGPLRDALSLDDHFFERSSRDSTSMRGATVRTSKSVIASSSGSTGSGKTRALSAGKTISAYSGNEDEIGMPFEPCWERWTHEYLNLPEVQLALHVGSNLTTWEQCNDLIYKNWNPDDWSADVTSLYGNIVNRGIKVLVFSGDVDGVCSTHNTQDWIYTVPGVSMLSQWNQWSVSDDAYFWQPAGYISIFTGGLTFATVRNAGHEVPMYRPIEAFRLFEQYMNGTAWFNKDYNIKKHHRMYGSISFRVNLTLAVHSSLTSHELLLPENVHIFNFIPRAFRHTLEAHVVFVQACLVESIADAKSSKSDVSAMATSSKLALTLRIDSGVSFDHGSFATELSVAKLAAESVGVASNANQLISGAIVKTLQSGGQPRLSPRAHSSHLASARNDEVLSVGAVAREGRTLMSQSESKDLAEELQLAALKAKESASVILTEALRSGTLDMNIQAAFIDAGIGHFNIPAEVPSDMRIAWEALDIATGFSVSSLGTTSYAEGHTEWDDRYSYVLFPDATAAPTSAPTSADDLPLFIVTGSTVTVIFSSFAVTMVSLMLLYASITWCFGKYPRLLGYTNTPMGRMTRSGVPSMRSGHGTDQEEEPGGEDDSRSGGAVELMSRSSRSSTSGASY